MYYSRTSRNLHSSYAEQFAIDIFYEIPRELNYNHKCSKTEASRVGQTEAHRRALTLDSGAVSGCCNLQCCNLSCCPMCAPAAVPPQLSNSSHYWRQLAKRPSAKANELAKLVKRENEEEKHHPRELIVYRPQCTQ